MSLPTLTIGEFYFINSPYGKSGKYILSEINLDKNKPFDIMYMFTDLQGNKIGFINRLFNPRGIKVILLHSLPPSVPPKNISCQTMPLPNEQQNFLKNDAPIITLVP
jgi:hypothetical protein